MTLSPSAWHRRYTQQARWTEALRQSLYQRAGLARARRVLDLGCGTGALLPELSRQTRASLHGLDLNPAYLEIAASQGRARLTLGDAHALPYAPACFDISLCHFLLLWVRDPPQVAAELRRVTRPGGSILALAEPDYGGRIDYPDELASLGALQARALEEAGAAPTIGRRLGSIFAAAGLQVVETGVLGGRWSGTPSRADWELEWQVLATDLGDRLDAERFKQLRLLDSAAWQRGERILFVPTFYAWAKVP